MDVVTQTLITQLPPDLPVLAATDTPRFHWLLTLRSGERDAWSVVLAVNQTEMEPQHHLASDHLVLGVEQGVFTLDRATGTVRAQIHDTTHVGWIAPIDGGPTLVASEDELLALGSHGGLLWRTHFPDVIQDVTVDGAHVVVTDMGGTTYRHDLTTGAKR